MDPIAAAGGFASIVGLLADFLARRDSDQQATFNEFSIWLHEHRHTEVMQLIQQSDQTVLGIKALLALNQQELVTRLDSMDRTLAAISASRPEFRALAIAVRPEAALSVQALDLLRAFRTSGASKALLLPMMSGPALMVIDGQQGMFAISDRQFLHDDLGMLAEHRLLIPGRNSEGVPMYTFTRAAAALADAATPEHAS